MIQRKAIAYLQEWKERSDRKPLVLRGARQVGKTTLVVEFAKQYDVFLHLNLEKNAEWNLFEQYDEVNELIQAIFLQKKQIMNGGSVLLFIDEIQNSPKAVAILRYFYEEAGHIHVIAAGSLLETIIDVRKISFPVGRVEYLAIRPCSFLEFLNGINNDFDAELIQNLKAAPVHDRIIKLFNDYALVGGMPAAISKYAENQDILALKRVYDSLLQSYKDDIEKYTKNTTTIKIIREILETGWLSAGSIITFEKFGGTDFSSKEMSLAFQTIQKAMLLELVFPTSNTRMPLSPNRRQRPKLIWIDTGLVNFVAGIQQEVFSVKNIQDVWRGKIAEQITAQELLTLNDSMLAKRIFWKRDKQGSEAEVDFIYPYNGLAIPVEVKSGHNSKLKSLHLFMDEAPHNFAVRVWSQPLSVDKVSTSTGKSFNLINLPFYYIGVIDKVLEQLYCRAV
ncbi:MAG: AAA family ATPase [Dysgonamonadaceae bacterium]|jgi:predicted AAA+ superfamily ATPase|nr:AAA family ATPase [Dysgonamonadaceae bacterium]